MFITLCDKAGYPRFTLGAANVDEAYRKVWAVLMGLVHKNLKMQNTEHMGLMLLDGDNPDMVVAGFSDARLQSTLVRVLATRGLDTTATVEDAVNAGPGPAGPAALVPAAAAAPDSGFSTLPAAVGASSAAAAVCPAAVGASTAVAAHHATSESQAAVADGLATSTAALAAADLPGGAAAASPVVFPSVSAAARASAAAAAAASELGYLDAAADTGSTADISDEDAFLDGAADDLNGYDSGTDAI